MENDKIVEVLRHMRSGKRVRLHLDSLEVLEYTGYTAETVDNALDIMLRDRDLDYGCVTKVDLMDEPAQTIEERYVVIRTYSVLLDFKLPAGEDPFSYPELQPEMSGFGACIDSGKYLLAKIM